MANITLSQSLLDTDLSSLGSTSKILENIEALSSVTESLLGDVEFLNKPTVSGNTVTYENPSFISELGTVTLSGKISGITDNYDNLISGNFSFNGFTVKTDDGKLKVKMSLNGSADSSKLNMNIKFSQLSFTGFDGSGWTINFDITANVNLNLLTGNIKSSSSQALKSIVINDENGNSVGYSGNIKWNSKTEAYSGYFTTQTITIGKSKLISNGLKLTADDFATDIEIGSIADMLPTLLAGNDVITLSSSDPIEGAVYGYDGNDKIIGSSNDDIIYGDGGENYGNDTINGGAGDDTLQGGGGNNRLTGGKGADIFFLSSEFIDAEIPKNTKITMITDFKDSEGDTLDIDFDYAVFKSLKIAATEKSSDEIVYESSTGKFWYDADGTVGGVFKPVCFAICVGIPTDE